jgi:hypothetical protein
LLRHRKLARSFDAVRRDPGIWRGEWRCHSKKRFRPPLPATIRGVRVSASPAAIEPGLKTFTIVDWTSSSRQIANPYTLIFTLRTDDGVISPDDAKAVWHGILEKTLKGEDLKKLGAED